MAHENHERLKAYILNHSVSQDYMIAKNEWFVTRYVMHDSMTECPCGQPIKEMCWIRNRATGEEVYVGNVCIKQFLGIETGNVFSGLKRIREDQTANVNDDLREYAFKAGLIYDREYEFLKDTRRKRKLSPAQLSWKRKINWRIINGIVVRDKA